MADADTKETPSAHKRDPVSTQKRPCQHTKETMSAHKEFCMCVENHVCVSFVSFVADIVMKLHGHVCQYNRSFVYVTRPLLCVNWVSFVSFVAAITMKLHGRRCRQRRWLFGLLICLFLFSLQGLFTDTLVDGETGGAG